MREAQLLDEQGEFADQQQNESVAAEVQIAIVSIKVLKIGKKQMTMGVFRQLQREDAVDSLTAKPRGAIWGQVNYFWGGCEGPQHLHLVWQKGTELRRDCFYPEPSRAFEMDARDTARDAERAAVYALVTAPPGVFVVELVNTGYHKAYKVTLKEDGSWWQLAEGVSEEYYFQRQWMTTDDRTYECHDRGITKNEWLRKMTWRKAWQESFEHTSLAKELRQKQLELRLKWTARWQEYRKLDQLFIAV